jgi:hypothetical protein
VAKKHSTPWLAVVKAVLFSSAVWLIAGVGFGFAATSVYAWHGSFLWIMLGAVVGSTGAAVSGIGWIVGPLRRRSALAQVITVTFAVWTVVALLTAYGLGLDSRDLSMNVVFGVAAAILAVAAIDATIVRRRLT